MHAKDDTTRAGTTADGHGLATYGNSFTQCHQVSDGETWQEQLAADLDFRL